MEKNASIGLVLGAIRGHKGEKIETAAKGLGGEMLGTAAGGAAGFATGKLVDYLRKHKGKSQLPAALMAVGVPVGALYGAIKGSTPSSEKEASDMGKEAMVPIAMLAARAGGLLSRGASGAAGLVGRAMTGVGRGLGNAYAAVGKGFRSVVGRPAASSGMFTPAAERPILSASNMMGGERIPSAGGRFINNLSGAAGTRPPVPPTPAAPAAPAGAPRPGLASTVKDYIKKNPRAAEIGLAGAGAGLLTASNKSPGEAAQNAAIMGGGAMALARGMRL